MAKLIMLRGLPGSGKSTRAKELAAEMGNTVRVNKDLLREMFHFGKWFPQNESGVWESERRLAQYYLAVEHQSVIIDDTNLTAGHEENWRTFVDDLQRKGLLDLEMEILNIDTDLKTCIERDSKRDRRVGGDVITAIAMANGMVDPNTRYIISDLDGTLADCSQRRHYVREKPKDWKKFFAEQGSDTLREDVWAQITKELQYWDNAGDKAELVIVTARPEIYREATVSWLAKHGIFGHAFTVIMRKAGDSREDSIVKREILHKYFPDKSKIIKVFDDRPRVIRMWQEEGLEVVDVGDGVEF